jgi:lysophospholipase L1-like esterase
VAASLVLLMVAPEVAAGGSSEEPADRRVFVIGDSVILGAQGAVAARLGASGWQVTQVSSESQHTYDAPGVINANAAAIGDVVVVSLGTNDGITPDQFAGWIDGVMESLQEVENVYWVNLRQFADWVPAANAQLVAAEDRWSNLSVIDWDARVTPDPALVAGDGIHLTTAGADAYAELIGSTVDGESGDSEATTTTTAATDPSTSSVTTEATSDAQAGDSTEGDDGIGALGTALVVAAVVGAGALAIFLTARRSAPARGIKPPTTPRPRR